MLVQGLLGLLPPACSQHKSTRSSSTAGLTSRNRLLLQYGQAGIRAQSRRRLPCAAFQPEPSYQPQYETQQRPRPRQAPRLAPQEFGTLLRRCQVVNKPVISTVSGKQLGLVSHFVVDPAQLTVVSLAIRPKGFKQTLSGLVDLSTVVQIGDVVLVDRDSVNGSASAALRRGYQRLSGCEVFTFDGLPLGKVRNFSFRPDTGRIASVQYDELGLPSIPETWVALFEVGVEHVHTVEQKRLTLRQRSTRAPLQLQEGSIGKLIAGALSLGWWNSFNSPEDMEVYEQWAAQNRASFERYYGQALPSTRQEYNAFMLGVEMANSPTNPPRQQQQQQQQQQASVRRSPPLQLPQPRQSAWRDQVVSSPPATREYESLPPLRSSRDPRTRQRMVELPLGSPPPRPPEPQAWQQQQQQPFDRSSPYGPEWEGGASQQRSQGYPSTSSPSAMPDRSSRTPEVQGSQQAPQMQPARLQRSLPSTAGPTNPQPPGAAAGAQSRGWREGTGWRPDQRTSGTNTQRPRSAGIEDSQQGRASQQNGSQRMNSSSKEASVPIIAARSIPPHQRRDVDGNYGTPPAPLAVQQQQGSTMTQREAGVQFREWALDDEQVWSADAPLSPRQDSAG